MTWIGVTIRIVMGVVVAARPLLMVAAFIESMRVKKCMIEWQQLHRVRSTVSVTIPPSNWIKFLLGDNHHIRF